VIKTIPFENLRWICQTPIATIQNRKNTAKRNKIPSISIQCLRKLLFNSFAAPRYIARIPAKKFATAMYLLSGSTVGVIVVAVTENPNPISNKHVYMKKYPGPAQKVCAQYLDQARALLFSSCSSLRKDNMDESSGPNLTKRIILNCFIMHRLMETNTESES
jgi:hypothetical protein